MRRSSVTCAGETGLAVWNGGTASSAVVGRFISSLNPPPFVGLNTRLIQAPPASSNFNMPVGDNLCQYCAHINFDLLYYPSGSELSDLRTSETRRHPSHSCWSLGLQSRIDESSSSCPLCHAICELLHQHPLVRDSWQHDSTALRAPVCIAYIETAGSLRLPSGSPRDNVSLRRVSLYWKERSEQNIDAGPVDKDHTFPNTPQLVECFQACIPGVLGRPPLKDVFNEEENSPRDLAFGGRLRPEILDPGLPTQWLSDCLANHGDACRLGGGGAIDKSNSHGNR